MFQISLGLLACALLGFTEALELNGTEEGACLADFPFNDDVDPAWFDTLPYYNGGSKYQLYRLASVHPEFSRMREFEFYYEACFVKNDSISGSSAFAFGFGQMLGGFDLQMDAPGVLIASPNNEQTGLRTDTLTLRVTLTDYTTFALMVGCWGGAINQRGWIVFSRVPQLDEQTQRLIEGHVQALGFRRENVVFLAYENCGTLDLDSILYPDGTPAPPPAQGENPRPQTGNIRPSGQIIRPPTSTTSTTSTPSPLIGKLNSGAGQGGMMFKSGRGRRGFSGGMGWLDPVTV